MVMMALRASGAGDETPKKGVVTTTPAEPQKLGFRELTTADLDSLGKAYNEARIAVAGHISSAMERKDASSDRPVRNHVKRLPRPEISEAKARELLKARFKNTLAYLGR